MVANSFCAESGHRFELRATVLAWLFQVKQMDSRPVNISLYAT